MSIFELQMTVAINLNVFSGGLAGIDKEWLVAVFGVIARKNPDHQFVFISAVEKGEERTGNNIKWLKSGVSESSLLRWRYWHSIQLPGLLKKLKADLFFSADYFFTPISVPQCIAGTSPDFLKHKDLFRPKYFDYYKKNIPVAIAKANYVLVPAEDSMQQIISHYKIAMQKLVVLPAATVYEPEQEDRTEAIKKEFTAGREYFINTSPVSKTANLLTLLKAFSLFKKRQQTGMKLVLAGEPGDNYDRVKKDLTSYKYRDDVVLTGTLSPSKKKQLLASSYAFVDTALLNIGYTSMTTALTAGIPVIAPAGTFGAPFIRIDASDITDIAAQMMLLYKDEALRGDLIMQGKTFATQLSVEQAANTIWQCLQNAAALK